MSSSSIPPRQTGGTHLDTQVSYRLGVPLVYVKGELDHDTAPTMGEVIRQELAPETTVLILDLSELAYMDSGGLSLMFDTVNRMKGVGWLGLVGPNAGVTRLLEITGLTDHPNVRVFSDLRAAGSAVKATAPAT